MNTGLKHWKEAATLILAAGHRLGADSLSSPGVVCSQPGKNERRPPVTQRFDYNVLLLKRSRKSGFMPNAYVFPGGMVDSSDFSSEWLEVFKAFTNSRNFGLRSVKQPSETRPPIFATDRLKLGSPIPGDVAFRICALRETFEESGVLLFVSKKDELSLLKSLNDRRAADEVKHYRVNELCSGELSRWRTLVNQNPSNFVRMCRELEVVPNIWALHEWANWLTPAGRYSVKRFDTAFFMCCLEERPHAFQDQKEIQHLQWSTPSDILQNFQDRDLWIAPPQYYELSRMCRFPSLSDLHAFARRRGTDGCEQWLPVIFLQDDSYVSVLPGDHLYPSNSSETTNVETPEGSESALHRFLISDPYCPHLQVNITPKYNHMLPLIGPLESKTPV
ncbi:nucleoside diphosphate-linked moiety X motif 19 isoform X2 [Phycodurus eques]|uniref:nucleoside diphosphate-linked moiety X motif 19 isoform X2 n=1 Tax=Phycodurus eques TaxID=693459 RepID=UPI002ACEDB88|nr:nucleoside diphosphate-linked moiety X motif 19 isoform X2 [Phycodurus eques]